MDGSSTSRKLRAYYAHSMGIYGRPQEDRDLATLHALGFEVNNPNRPEMQEAADRLGMAAFKCEVEACDVLAFRAHADGGIGAGVAQEIAWAINAGMPVFELPSGINRRVLTVENTREWLRESGAR
jgi:hypothetical protein